MQDEIESKRDGFLVIQVDLINSQETGRSEDGFCTDLVEANELVSALRKSMDLGWSVLQ